MKIDYTYVFIQTDHIAKYVSNIKQIKISIVKFIDNSMKKNSCCVDISQYFDIRKIFTMQISHLGMLSITLKQSHHVMHA